MILVLDYAPLEGEESTTVTVTLELWTSSGKSEYQSGQEIIATGLQFRLVFGRAAVKTTMNYCFPSMVPCDVLQEPDDWKKRD